MHGHLIKCSRHWKSKSVTEANIQDTVDLWMINQYHKSCPERPKWSLLRVTPMHLLKSRQLATVMYTERLYKLTDWMAINERFQLVRTYCTNHVVFITSFKEVSFNSKHAIFCLASSFPTFISLYCHVIPVCTFVVAPLSFQEGWHSVLLSPPQFLHHGLLVVFECPQ